MSFNINKDREVLHLLVIILISTIIIIIEILEIKIKVAGLQLKDKIIMY